MPACRSREPVAGISIGMLHNDSKEILITDILGEEDHFGDMDFKVAGTQNGITGIQLDLKVRGLRQETIVQALERAREARLAILESMLTVLDKPRATISEHAPRILTIRIDPDKIGKVIGPGGKGIKRIEAETGATIEIEEDGTVMIACVDRKGAEKARDEDPEGDRRGANRPALHRQGRRDSGLRGVHRDAARDGWAVPRQRAGGRLRQDKSAMWSSSAIPFA